MKKRFDFRAKLKGLDLTSLKQLKDYHLDLMLGFMGYNDKEADKYSRYLGYIEDRIRKINENVDNQQNGFTIGELKKMIEGMDDNTPVLLVNPVGRGSNQFVGDNIEIGDIIVSEDGISYTTNMSHIKHTIKTKGLLIYEG